MDDLRLLAEPTCAIVLPGRVQGAEAGLRQKRIRGAAVAPATADRARRISAQTATFRHAQGCLGFGEASQNLLGFIISFL